MSVRRIYSKAAAVVAVVAACLFVASCDQGGHPDRSATFDDVKAGTACIAMPVSIPVWKETDREYVGENGYCRYKE